MDDVGAPAEDALCHEDEEEQPSSFHFHEDKEMNHGMNGAIFATEDENIVRKLMVEWKEMVEVYSSTSFFLLLFNSLFFFCKTSAH